MPLTTLITEHALFRPALAALVVLSFGVYSVLNKPSDKAIVLTTRFDERIPFLPAFSVPYLLYLPYLFFITIYGIIESPYYLQIVASALVIQLAAGVIYYFQQTHMPRPVVKERGVFNRLTRFIYSYDQPYCTFPSLHVAYSVFCAFWSLVLFPQVAPLFLLLSASIIASTVFIKQHAVVDVLAGMFLTALSLGLVLGF